MDRRTLANGATGNDLIAGIAAGAIGTAAIDIVTYADMAIRGRPASEVPRKTARALAEKAHVPLASGSSEHAERRRTNRASGLGALLGYATGLGVGAAYGLGRALLADLPLPLVGVALGAAAMAASDVSAASLGVTRPSEWSAAGWIADVVPHLVYGMVTTCAYEMYAGTRR